MPVSAVGDCVPGGRNGTTMEQVIFGQEEARYAVPTEVFVIGLGMMASFVFMVTGAWLLLVGVETGQGTGPSFETQEATDEHAQ